MSTLSLYARNVGGSTLYRQESQQAGRHFPTSARLQPPEPPSAAAIRLNRLIIAGMPPLGFRGSALLIEVCCFPVILEISVAPGIPRHI
jgi:hypothetical protein